MSKSPGTSVLDRIFDPSSRCLDEESARRVLALDVDPVVQALVDFLAERANQGQLTPEERSEYDACINADDFIATLQMKVRRILGLDRDACWVRQFKGWSADEIE